MRTMKKILLTTSLLALGACSGLDSFSEVEALNNAQPVGGPFTQALSSHYAGFANTELHQNFDYPDALYFARKGLAAAAGETVLPEPVADWNVGPQDAQELSNGRSRLIAAYNQSSRETLPNLSAEAQYLYDCWIEFQEENWKDPSSSTCQTDFLAIMNQIEARLGPVPVEPPPAEPPAPAPAFNSEVFDINPEEPMAIQNAMYLIFFNWDSSKIGDAAMNILNAVKDEAAKVSPDTISVVGHTDTSGPTDYNQRLAVKRAKATKSELIKRGIDPATILLDAKGETDLLVPTPDNVREPANRRVNISFQ